MDFLAIDRGLTFFLFGAVSIDGNDNVWISNLATSSAGMAYLFGSAGSVYFLMARVGA